MLVALPEDCLLHIFLFLEPRKIISCSRLCKRLRQLSDHAVLWRFVFVSGNIIQATNLLQKGIIPRSSLIKGIGFINISLLVDVVQPESETGVSLRQDFINVIDDTFKVLGPYLEALHVEDSLYESYHNMELFSDSMSARSRSHHLSTADNPESFVEEAHHIFESVAQYCKSLLRISVMLPRLSVSRTEALNILLLLTNCCPKVKEFRDDESVLLGCGADFHGGPSSPPAAISAGIRYMVDGWKDLKSLEISTGMLTVSEFCESLRLFGAGLRRLSVTHFRDPLGNQRMAWAERPDAEDKISILATTLSRLVNLEVIAIDLSMTAHRDGLTMASTEKIITSCPKLKGFEYFAPFEAYFEDDEMNDKMSLFGNRNFLNPNQNDDAASAYTSLMDGKSGRKFNPAVESMLSRSRRGSASSVSVMTVNTGYYFYSGYNQHRSRSILSKDDDDLDEDVTSLAPGLPSPNPLGSQRIEVGGTWVPTDSMSIRDRAEEELLLYGRSLSKRHLEFFSILEEISKVCQSHNVGLTLAWAL
ncbi:hypothetical protein HDU97_005893 [Phlyctochytrium planicorne]|nr:hypothetical protein HDU97_005893 [Phlyctochytrium planicorne]